ncbi:MAG: hypothetical protein ABIT58_05125, partial [Ferruginibacter sp.]
TLTYNSQRSPFSFISNFKAHQNFPNGETLFFEYLPFSNISTMEESYSGSNFTYTYTSGLNGLPSTIIISDPATGESYKIIYTYRNL